MFVASIAALVVLGLLALQAPAAVAAPPPKIYLYAHSMPVSSRFSVDVSTIDAGSSAGVRLQVREGGKWHTIATRPVNKYSSYQSYRYTTPSVAQTLEFRALLLRNGKRVAMSKSALLRVVGSNTSTSTPSAPQTPTSLPTPEPAILRAEVPGQQGEWMTIGNYQFRFGPTIAGEPAWRTVGTETLAKKPAAGFSIVLASVDYQMSVPPTLGVGNDVKFEYLGNDGAAYGPGEEFAPAGWCNYSLSPDLSTGNPKYDKSGVGPGGYPRLYACAVVKDTAISGGHWQVGPQYSTSTVGLQFAQAAMSQTLPFTKGHAPLAPYSQGDWFEVPFVYGKYGLQFQQTVAGAEAWKVFADFSSNYRPPPAGWSIVLGNATIQNRGTQDGAPFLEVLAPDFIGGDGNVYNGYDELAPGGACPWIPSDMYARSLSAGATMQITTCAVVPDSAISGGVWRVTPLNPFLLPKFFYVTSGR